MYTIEKYRRYGFAATCLVLALLLLVVVRPIWTAMGWGATLAVLMHPIHRRLLKRFNPNSAAFLTCSIAFFAIVLPLTAAGFAGVHELRLTLKSARASLDQAENTTWLAQIDSQLAAPLKKLGVHTYTVADWYTSASALAFFCAPPVGEMLMLNEPNNFDNIILPGSRPSDFIKKSVDPALKSIPQIIKGILSAALLSAMAVILLFFALRDGAKIREPVLQLMPLAPDRGEKILRMMYDTIHATFYGVVLISFVNGVLITAIYALLGIPVPFLFGIVTTIVSFVPIAGPPFVWLPTAMWLASQGQWVKAVTLCLLGLFVIGLAVDKLYRSHLIGSKINLHSMVVMFSLLGGMFVLGPIGAFIGPVIVILTIAALEVLREIGKTAA